MPHRPVNRRLLTCALACLPVALGGCAAWQQQQAAEHLARGQALVKSGDTQAALAELRQALTFQGDLAEAHTAIGDIHRNRGEHPQAREAYEAACRADPYAFRPHYNLGVTYQVLAAAAKAADQARDLLKKAVDVYLRAVNIRENDFDTHLNLSACYHQLGKDRLAEKYCRQAVALRPDSARAHCNLGIILDAQGRYEQAVRAYHASLERDVDQPDILVALGAIYLRQGRTKTALRNFVLAAKKVPTHAAAWSHMALAYFRLGYYEYSLASYGQAVKISPKDDRVHRSLGIVAMTLYLLHPSRAPYRDRALEAWRTSLALNPDQPDLNHLYHKYSPPPPTGPPIGPR